METISLTPYAFLNWKKKQISQLKKLLFALLIILFANVVGVVFSSMLSDNTQQLAFQQSEIEQKTANYQKWIKQIQQTEEGIMKGVNTEKVDFFFDLIWNIPAPQGGLEEINLFLDEEDNFKIKLSGTFKDKNEFAHFERYLKDKVGNKLAIESLNLTGQNETTFSFLVSL